MAKSKLIKDLACGNVSISDAFYRLLVIAGDLDNKTLLNWASNEINGYSNCMDVPNYRIIHSLNFQYSGINGGFQVSNSPLNPMIFNEKTLESIKTLTITEGVKSIENKSDSNKTLHRDLTYLAGEVYKNSGGIQCISISQRIESSAFTNILSSIKTKLIQVLQKLEREYGNIDDLDVGTGDKSEQEIKQFTITIERLIYENNSVSIGNDNSISKAGIEAGKNE